MNDPFDTIPVVLFAYNRLDCLRQTLESLKVNRVPMLIVYSDGGKNADDTNKIESVRKLIRGIDWCEVRLIERGQNFGLGKSILTGVSSVLCEYPAIIVSEDDLIFAEGAYPYLCAALIAYANDPKVMSVTGWTHPRFTPQHEPDQPYFDGRAESWSWGTWSRAWTDMDRPALELLLMCREKQIDPDAYGADLIEMAEVEKSKNLWAVRFLLLHILKGGLCLRPPYSMVENIGFGEAATNTHGSTAEWSNWPLKKCPPIPHPWPAAIEYLECRMLWSKQYPYIKKPSFFKKVFSKIKKGSIENK